MQGFENLTQEEIIKRYGQSTIEGGPPASAPYGIPTLTMQASFSDAVTTQAKGLFARSYLDGLHEAVKKAPVGQRFEAIKSYTDNKWFDGDFEEIVDVFEKTGDTHLQEAFGNALTNPSFINYLAEKASGGGKGTLFTKDSLEEGLKANGGAGVMSDVLTTIANGDGFKTPEDFKKLDAITDSIAALNRAQTGKDPKAITKANDLLIDALAKAGGNIPALARLQNHPEYLMQFFGDMLNQNTDFAIQNLISKLDMSPEEAQAFQNLMGRLAGIMDFMVRPYAEYYQAYASRFANQINRIQNDANTLLDSDRVQLTKGDVAAAAGSGRPLPGDDKAIRVSNRPKDSFNGNASGIRNDGFKGYDRDDLAASTPKVAAAATGPGMMSAPT